MIRLILSVTTFGVLFGACSDRLPTAQEAVAQTHSATATDEAGDSTARNPETHDIYPRPGSEAVGDDEGSSTDDGEADEPLEGTVNLNDASPDALKRLPGIGPAIAERILEYRRKRRFEEPAHIQRVRGIGETTFQKLEAHLAVDGATTLTD